ncbi:hypothetical protein [Labilibaculum antarcticum]|uniref:Uncharacterized protein n=1 Tax=Labilibaculum antarcticum TaxID=1717717 RepID=A0A1Y1CNE5_9BACT|nr:hypothetical protein [Labilibaculum antarcticum]BAX81472.1 hypothetical protein ALGA_3172 [Labilibaculum antarcticum]
MNKLILIIFGIIIFVSCQNNTDKKPETYMEINTSFFDLRNGDLTKNNWIRNPENLLMVHETLKKFNYMDLLKQFYHDSDVFILQGLYIKKDIVEWVDSLILTHGQANIDSKYYREFWNRREQEKNDSIVFEILKDIQKYKFSKIGPAYSEEIVNDTLFDLLTIEFEYDTITKAIAEKNFSKLVEYGFHESAYNLLLERYEYYDVDWDRNELKKRLKKIDKNEGVWLIDNTK